MQGVSSVSSHRALLVRNALGNAGLSHDGQCAVYIGLATSMATAKCFVEAGDRV